MARAYHNLNGFMRDVEHALDEGVEDAYKLAELLILIDDLITDKGRDALLGEADDEPVQRGDVDVDVRDDRDGSQLLAPPARHGTVRRPKLDSVSRVVPAALGHARAAAAAEAAAGPNGGAEALVRTARPRRSR